MIVFVWGTYIFCRYWLIIFPSDVAPISLDIRCLCCVVVVVAMVMRRCFVSVLPGCVETARDPTGAPATPTVTSAAPSEPPPAAVTGNVAQNGENKPPQAIVKPHVLTHVIEGFVIQEGAEPFPVSCNKRTTTTVLNVTKTLAIFNPD